MPRNPSADIVLKAQNKENAHIFATYSSEKHITVSSMPRFSRRISAPFRISSTQQNVSHMCYKSCPPNYIPGDRTAGPMFRPAAESCNSPATPTGYWTSCPAGRQAPWCTSARQLRSARRVRVRIGGATTSAHPAGSSSNYRQASHVPAVYIVF